MLKIPGKIPVSIYPFFWIVAFLIGWLSTANIPGTVIWAAIILISVLVHEFGHALTAVAFGQHAQIELIGFGGVTQRRGAGKINLWKEFLIVLNGPLAGFCLSGVAYLFYKSLAASQHQMSVLTYAAEVTFYVNFFWTILNLIPVQPLDGGKLLSIVLEGIFGLKGTKIALFISLVLAAGLGILFFVMREFFIGSLFMLFTFESYKSWKQSLDIKEEDQNVMLQHLMKDAEQDLRLGNSEAALNNFQRIRSMSQDGVIYQAATENTARLLAEKGDFKSSYDILKGLGKKLSPLGQNLLHQLAYSQKQWEEAIALGDRVYHQHPNYETAVINAASHAALGHVKQAVGWIQCAIQDGVPHVRDVLAKREFDSIRNDPIFRSLQEDL